MVDAFHRPSTCVRGLALPQEPCQMGFLPHSSVLGVAFLLVGSLRARSVMDERRLEHSFCLHSSVSFALRLQNNSRRALLAARAFAFSAASALFLETYLRTAAFRPAGSSTWR